MELVIDVSMGGSVVREATPEELVDLELRRNRKPTEIDYVEAIQKMLDDEAKSRKYDGILSASTYATSTVPRFKNEGQACVMWRDAVWAKAYDVLAQVKAGTIPQPSIEELISMMPAMEWPDV